MKKTKEGNSYVWKPMLGIIGFLAIFIFSGVLFAEEPDETGPQAVIVPAWEDPALKNVEGNELVTNRLGLDVESSFDRCNTDADCEYDQQCNSFGACETFLTLDDRDAECPTPGSSQFKDLCGDSKSSMEKEGATCRCAGSIEEAVKTAEKEVEKIMPFFEPENRTTTTNLDTDTDTDTDLDLDLDLDLDTDTDADDELPLPVEEEDTCPESSIVYTEEVREAPQATECFGDCSGCSSSAPGQQTAGGITYKYTETVKTATCPDGTVLSEDIILNSTPSSIIENTCTCDQVNSESGPWKTTVSCSGGCVKQGDDNGSQQCYKCFQALEPAESCATGWADSVPSGFPTGSVTTSTAACPADTIGSGLPTKYCAPTLVNSEIDCGECGGGGETYKLATVTGDSVNKVVTYTCAACA